MNTKTLGECLRSTKERVRPTEALYLLLDNTGWITSQKAQQLITEHRYLGMDDWDAYISHEWIFLYGPDGRGYHAFEAETAEIIQRERPIKEIYE